MITIKNPPGQPEPAGYHHGIEVSGDVRTLYIAGQIGVLPDGTVAQGIEAQTRAVYANMQAVLEGAGMGFADVVKSTVYLVDRQHRAAFSTGRAEAMGGLKSASTLLFVSGLALPELLVEVEAVAVKPAAG